MLTFQTWFNAFFNEVAAASTSNGSSATDPIWLLATQPCIDYSEQRLYRELDLLATRVTDASGSLAAKQRVFALPMTVGTFLKVEGVNVITPVGALAATGDRNPLVPYSRAYLDATWPANSSANGLPQVYAMYDNANIVLGPAPDQPYTVEIFGTQRPLALSSANQNTFLGTVLPDLFFAGTMIKASLFMRDDALQRLWEAEYMQLFKSADVEEAGKMYRSQGWTAEQPRAVTQPPRV